MKLLLEAYLWRGEEKAAVGEKRADDDHLNFSILLELEDFEKRWIECPYNARRSGRRGFL